MAYSTCGQLGLMFMAVGVSAYGPAMFHLTTHAFFKALLFLSVGSLTHALSGEQNLKAMGGMAGLTPVTFGIMGIGCLSLMGLPFFSGYYSKEAILACLWSHHSPLAQLGLGVGFGVVGLTAFYCARLLMLVFRGSFRGNPIVLGHAQESSFTLLAPLLPLIIGAVFVGGAQAFFIDNPCLWNSGLGHAGVPPTIPLLPARLPSRLHPLPLVVSALALSVAFFLYSPRHNRSLFLQPASSFFKIFLNGWGIDGLYTRLVVGPFFSLATFVWRGIDCRLIDRCGPQAMATAVQQGSRILNRLQTGILQQYALLMVGGLVLFLAYLWYTLHKGFGRHV
jgi:NADH-quinone oxidoreductase subunit L